MDEYETFREIRLPEKKSVWRVVHGSVFHFPWWDPTETACNPPPKGEYRR